MTMTPEPPADAEENTPKPLKNLPRRAPADDFPHDDIAKLRSSGVEKVCVQIKRRNDKGQWAALGSGYTAITMTMEQLCDIEDWIVKRAGGGW